MLEQKHGRHCDRFETTMIDKDGDRQGRCRFRCELQ
jgi:hypothetical protein